MREARGWVGWARLTPGPAHSRLLFPRRIARLQLEAQAHELRQAEVQAQRAQEEQAWVQLKEQEVLKLQVGRGREECGYWRFQQGRLWESSTGCQVTSLQEASLSALRAQRVPPRRWSMKGYRLVL